jgi:6-pyruvoyltetrahydropterin/6-carboxytetrahydropterin synthase
MKFSAGHFTIFSATERERLHGHNFKVQAILKVLVNEDGMSVDYGIFKKTFRELCNELDEYMLLPEKSPHLKFEFYEDAKQKKLKVKHHNDTLDFYEKDVKLLPVANITVEELSKLLLNKALKEYELEKLDLLNALKIKVASGEGQYASAEWIQNKHKKNKSQSTIS